MLQKYEEFFSLFLYIYRCNALTPTNSKQFHVFAASMKTPLTDVAVYEPEEKKWVNQVDIPTARGSGSSYTYQGKLMIVGGFTVSGLSNAVEMVGPS